MYRYGSLRESDDDSVEILGRLAISCVLSCLECPYWFVEANIERKKVCEDNNRDGRKRTDFTSRAQLVVLLLSPHHFLHGSARV